MAQIEVSFEIDANGILNVGAEDKGTGKAEKITITAEKGRLSQDEIERMVQEAEEFAEEDKKVKDRIDGRNALEGYLYNGKNSIEDEEKGDYEEKQKEVEKIVNPIMQNVDQGAGGEGGGGGDEEEEDEDDEDQDEL